MTLKEALSLSVKNLGVDPLLIDLALIDANLNGDATYTADMELVRYQVEYKLLTNPGFIESIQEGGYAIKYNNSGIAARLSFLAKALGLEVPGENAQPVIRDVSHLW